MLVWRGGAAGGMGRGGRDVMERAVRRENMVWLRELCVGGCIVRGGGTQATVLPGNGTGGVQVNLWERCTHGIQRTGVRLEMVGESVEAGGGGGVCAALSGFCYTRRGAGRWAAEWSYGRGGGWGRAAGKAREGGEAAC